MIRLVTLTGREIAFEFKEGLCTKEIIDELFSSQKINRSDCLVISKGVVLSQSEPLSDESVLFLQYTDEIVDEISTSGWDAKNRILLLQSIRYIRQRRFEDAAPILADALTTFTLTDFIPFPQLTRFALVTGAIAFDRTDISSKLLKCPEIMPEREGNEFYRLLDSLYHCRYVEFLRSLAACISILESDWLLAPHTIYIVKALRVKAYSQILRSYSSLTLDFLSTSFGVTSAFIESDIANFIASKKLDCVIDKVAGVVITNVPDARNLQYLSFMQQSKTLLDSMQRLSRILGN